MDNVKHNDLLRAAIAGKNTQIEVRYDVITRNKFGERTFEYRAWTPAQRRRIRKQKNKWKKRILSQPLNFDGINPSMGVGDEIGGD
jgi:hypothetical protein